MHSCLLSTIYTLFSYPGHVEEVARRHFSSSHVAWAVTGTKVTRCQMRTINVSWLLQQNMSYRCPYGRLLVFFARLQHGEGLYMRKKVIYTINAKSFSRVAQARPFLFRSPHTENDWCCGMKIVWFARLRRQWTQQYTHNVQSTVHQPYCKYVTTNMHSDLAFLWPGILSSTCMAVS